MDLTDITYEIASANYISCNEIGIIQVHKNMRDIANIYNINHSTISKAFSKNKNNCISCKSKDHGIIVIRTLCNM